MYNSFINEIKDDIVERLEGMTGQEHYLCDLGFTITLDENNAGSWGLPTDDVVRQLIAEHKIFKNVWDELKFSLGNEFVADLNPFADADKCHIVLMIELYRMIFDFAVQDMDEWNGEITITEEFIENVKDKMDATNYDFLIN